MALLARLSHEMTTAPAIGEALAAVDGADLVRDAESEAAVNVREIRRGYDRAVKLPKELVEELARVTTRAQQVWQEARQANDFPAFRPWLEKVVKLKPRGSPGRPDSRKGAPLRRGFSTNTNRERPRRKSSKFSRGCRLNWCR